MNTIFLLLAEYETSSIDLNVIAKKYFGLTERDKISRMARHNEFPFPVFRAGTQRSGWHVSVQDLAEWLDKERKKAREDFEVYHRAS